MAFLFLPTHEKSKIRGAQPKIDHRSSLPSFGSCWQKSRGILPKAVKTMEYRGNIVSSLISFGRVLELSHPRKSPSKQQSPSKNPRQNLRGILSVFWDMARQLEHDPQRR
jgi:hypothetical protein